MRCWSVSVRLAQHWEVELGSLDALHGGPGRSRARPRRRYLLMVALLVLASCDSVDNVTRHAGTGTPDSAGELSETGDTTTTAEDDPTTGTSPDPDSTDGTEPPRADGPRDDCSPHEPDDALLSGLLGADPADVGAASASIAVSELLYDCALEVGLAYADDPAAVVTLQSREIQGPLLLIGRWIDAPLLAELKRLAPERVLTAGIPRRILRYTFTDFDTEPVDLDPEPRLSLDGLSTERVWLVDNFALAVPMAAIAHQIGVPVITVPNDIRGASAEAREMIAAASEVVLLSDFGDDAAWHLDVIRRGDEVPYGGLLLFDSEPRRRMVAIYGHPQTSGLGVLGEQGPDEAVERLRAIARGYDADGIAVLPTFEIIATVAAGSAGYDGNYSNETALDVIRPWIEVAAANGIYVVLDLQPGLSDYLSQAKIYEEFLRLPHVGLALDPEWRLKPGQRHLRQIGTVDAAEINQVVRWLAGIVREESLPQKLLVLHQFRHSMITNRHLVETPAELAVLVHMDGQGRLATKYSTWNALTRQPDADQFYWGWKNFYDEDSPTATPGEVLALTPTPLFVSYQ